MKWDVPSGVAFAPCRRIGQARRPCLPRACVPVSVFSPLFVRTLHHTGTPCNMHHFNSNGPVKDGLYMCLLHSSACEEQAAWQYGTAITHSLGHDRDKTVNTFQLNHPRSPHALQNIKYHFIFFTRNISVPVLPFSCCFFLVQIHYLQKTCLSLITSYSFNHLTSTSGMFYHN